MLILPFFTTNAASRIFVRMDEHDCDTTFLSLAQSNSSAVDTKNQYRPFDDPTYHVLKKNPYSSIGRKLPNIAPAAGCKLLDADMLLCILLLLFEIWMMKLIVSRSRADCRVKTVSPRDAATGHAAVETWPFWMLSPCHLNTLTIQVAPASRREEGFEIFLLRRGSDSSDGKYDPLPIENQVLRRGFVRSKRLTRFEVEMNKHHIGSLHVRNRKAEVFRNPVLSSVAEAEDEIEQKSSRDVAAADRATIASSPAPKWVPPAISFFWKHSFSVRKEKSTVGGFEELIPLPFCSLGNMMMHLVPASNSDDGFEWIALRQGSTTNDCYGLEPEAPDHRRRGLFRLKERSRFELEQQTFNLGKKRLYLKSPSQFLPCLDEESTSNFTAEVSGKVFNPNSTAVITQRMVDAMQREENILKLQDEKYKKMMARELQLRAPRKKPKATIIPERMLPEPLRLVFDLAGDAPFAPRKIAKPSSYTFPKSCILFPCPEDKVVQSTTNEKVSGDILPYV